MDLNSAPEERPRFLSVSVIKQEFEEILTQHQQKQKALEVAKSPTTRRANEAVSPGKGLPVFDAI